MITKADLNETLRTIVYSYHTQLYSLNDITNVIGKSDDIQYFGAA
jgi:hypothetical protein